MKRILVIKDGLSTGGTTTSFIAFLYCLTQQKKFSVDVWVGNASDAQKTQKLPEDIRCIQNRDLEAAFCLKTGMRKWISLIREGNFFSSIYYRLFSNKIKSKKNTISLFQKMSIRKAKKQAYIDLSEYDAVITWEELYPCYLLAEKIKAKKKLAWIHPHYENCGFEKNYDLPFFEKLDAIITVSGQCQESMQKVFPEFKEKIYAISNAILVEDIIKKSHEEQTDIIPINTFNIVTVARLQNISKALDRAIRIASHLKGKGYNFKWYFIGDGEDKKLMLDMITTYGLQQEIILLGNQNNPYKYMKAADLFVLQSYYEGRPMVIDEAIVLGIPVFASNYGSAREQISSSNGIVVENDENAIFTGLKDILDHQDGLIAYRKNLKKINLEEYRGTSRYVNFLEEVINK